MEIKEHVSLAALTTMKVGGPARYFCIAASLADVKKGIAFAREKKVPLFVLGGGSNLLVGDGGIQALVMHVGLTDITTKEEKNELFVTVGAGMQWDTLVSLAVSRGAWGIENLSAIPGTVGGAVVQNIGAYGTEIEKIITEVLVYDPEIGDMRTLSHRECKFSYRDSIFKHEGKEFVILRATFRLKLRGAPNIRYKDLAAYFLEVGNITPTLAEIRDAVITIRAKKFPDLSVMGTAGSFFKNPVVPNATAEAFLRQYPDAPHFDAGEGHTKLSAAWIIDNILHMRGVRVGNVSCSERQALVILNHGGASARELDEFTRMIQKKSLDACNIALEAEVISVGEKF